MSNPNHIFTIGHSNHSLDAFLALLQQHRITALADVRSHPYSRHLSHFNKSPLEASLKQADIGYVFLGQELGARPDNPDCYLDGKALYDRIAATPDFSRGIQRLIKGVQNYRIALMCAEKDPMTCHRAILVCQHLREYDLDINHILKDGQLESHQQLETRLLAAHSLDDATVNKPQQLSLFEQPQKDDRPRSQRLKLAYHQQGDRIAYVEKTHD
ncbi:MAG: DUF488 family protein [Hormoscilla sp.]